MEIKKEDLDITVIELDQMFRNIGSWHSNLDIKFKDAKFKLLNNPSGCGSLILCNYSSSNLTDFKESLQLVLSNLSTGNYRIAPKGLKYTPPNDVGMVCTTLGQSYYSTFLPVFKELGFKERAEYGNPRHSGEKQCLLVWTK